jgi:AraC family transcriptional regulator
MSMSPSPALSSLCIGRSTVVKSSAELAWRGFLLERQLATSDMRIGDRAEQSMLAMVCSPLMRGEHVTKSGRAVAVRKTAGQVTVIPRGSVPEMRLLGEAELVYCSFDGNFIDRVVDQMDGYRPDGLEFRSGLRDKSLNQLLQMLTAEFEAGNPTGKVYAESLAEALALRFLHLGSTMPIDVPAKVSTLPSNKLARVKDLVESSIDQDLTLDALANEAGYSRAHFLRMFRKSTGITPHQYVIQRRIEHAETLLAANELGVAEIAVACGFSSQAHLTLAFRKHTGVTPAEYRRFS